MAEITEAKTVRTVRGVTIKVTPKAIIRIKLLALTEMLYELKGAKIVTLHTLTDARLRKTSKMDRAIKNPYPNVRKLSIVNGLFNVDYGNCVNNQLDRENKENDFESAGRQWGEKVNDSKVLIQHKGKLYFQFNPRNHVSTIYINERGQKLHKLLIEDFISDKSSSSRQGTDNKIIWRTYKADSILGVSVDKVFYEVI